MCVCSQCSCGGSCDRREAQKQQKIKRLRREQEALECKLAKVKEEIYRTVYC